MDITNVKSMIQKNIIDFTELVLNNYYKIGLDETDAIIIIKLNYLLNRNVTFIHPKKLAEMLSISTNTATRRLNNLIEQGYINIELVRNGNGKETEVFNLDYVIEKIMKADFEEKISIQDQTEESRLVQLFETEFRKPLSVLDIQTITRFPREHPRCGTAFLLTVFIFSILLFSALGPLPVTARVVSRILLLPVLASLAYEYLRLTAKFSQYSWARIFMAPNLWLQRLTTVEPDEKMIDVALTAFQAMRTHEDKALCEANAAMS